MRLKINKKLKIFVILILIIVFLSANVLAGICADGTWENSCSQKNKPFKCVGKQATNGETVFELKYDPATPYHQGCDCPEGQELLDEYTSYPRCKIISCADYILPNGQRYAISSDGIDGTFMPSNAPWICQWYGIDYNGCENGGACFNDYSSCNENTGECEIVRSLADKSGYYLKEREQYASGEIPLEGYYADSASWQREVYTGYDDYGNPGKIYSGGYVRYAHGEVDDADLGVVNTFEYSEYPTSYPAHHAYLTKQIQDPTGLNFETTARYNLNFATLERTETIYGNEEENPVTEYEYDNFGRLKFVTPPGENEPTLEYEYSISKDDYEHVKTTQKINAYTSMISYAYFDALGRQISSELIVNNGDNDILTKTTYDSVGRVKEQFNPFKEGQGPDPKIITSYNENPLERVSAITLQDGNAIHKEYGSLLGKNYETTIDESGNRKRTTFDKFRNIIAVEEGSSSSFDATASYRYDVFGNLKTSNDPNGYFSFTTYNNLGNVLINSNPDSGSVMNTYDKKGNLIEISSSNFVQNPSFEHGEDNWRLGNYAEIANSNPSQYHETYGTHCLKIGPGIGDWGAEQYMFAINNELVGPGDELTLSAQIRGVGDLSGCSETGVGIDFGCWHYDEEGGNIIPEQEEIPLSRNFENFKIELLSGGNQGELPEPQDIMRDTIFVDARGSLSESTYREFHETLSITFADTDYCVVIPTKKCASDAWVCFDGIVVTKGDAVQIDNGFGISFEYDNLNRIKNKYYRGQNEPIESYFYDEKNIDGKGMGHYAKGKLVKVVDESGATYFDYDIKGRLVKELRIMDGIEFLTEYRYDSADKIVEITNPAGDVIHYNYNNINQIESVELNGEYVAEYQYNPGGQIKTKDSNSVVTDLTYNNRNLLTSIFTSENSYQEPSLFKRTYAYYPTGSMHMMAYDVDMNEPGSFDGQILNDRETFIYDSLDRLTNTLYDDNNYHDDYFDYSYDASGNRLMKFFNNGCSNDAECTDPIFPACKLNTHECVECTNDNYCLDPLNPACDLEFNECFRCANDNHCTDPLLPACKLNTHECVECTNDNHCSDTPEMPHCRYNLCRECLSNSHCPEGMICNGGNCMAFGSGWCSSDKDCPSGQRCIEHRCFADVGE